MDLKLFEALLYEDESETLDFKRDQYPFSQASDEQKSELLKDIVGFANAWRRADAYLLIGVEQARGGRSKVVGVSEHLPDHSLQQFVAGALDVPCNLRMRPSRMKARTSA
jgi:predicted HTH transcriptional regulator